MTKPVRHLLIVLLWLLAAPSHACRNAPEASTWSKDELIANTPTIVLAELVSIYPDTTPPTFVFRKVEAIKGDPLDTFILQLDALPSRTPDTDFDAHTDSAFWNANGGRLSAAGGPCLPQYSFQRKGQYLLFLESMANGASAERIARHSDQWLEHARKEAKNYSPKYGMLGLSLVAAGCVLSFFCVNNFIYKARFRYMLIPFLIILIGIGLVAWQVVVMLAVFSAVFLLGIYAFHLKEKAYHRNYPVFDTDAIRAFTTGDGFDFRLHIAKVRSRFIIGIIYDTEVDLTPMTIQTRWKDEFDDYACAERTLLFRLRDFISEEHMPDLST